MQLTPEAKDFISELKINIGKVEMVYEMGKHLDKESMLTFLHILRKFIRMVERLED